MRSPRHLALILLLCSCSRTHGPDPVATTDGSESADTSTSTSSDTDDTSETGVAPIEVTVKWIEVAASDYKLELQPDFDAMIHQYTALADGPGISVYVDVIVDADVDGVLVNDVPAALIGFRMWRSAAETGLVSPCLASVTIELEGAVVPEAYAIDIVAP